MSVTMTIKVDDGALVTLEEIARGREISREAVVEEAVADYAAFEAEQIAKIREGIAAADRGDFASKQEVEEFFSKYRDL